MDLFIINMILYRLNCVIFIVNLDLDVYIAKNKLYINHKNYLKILSILIISTASKVWPYWLIVVVANKNNADENTTFLSKSVNVDFENGLNRISKNPIT